MEHLIEMHKAHLRGGKKAESAFWKHNWTQWNYHWSAEVHWSKS